MHHVGNAWNALDYCLEYPFLFLFLFCAEEEKTERPGPCKGFDYCFDTEKTQIKGIERTFFPLFLCFKFRSYIDYIL